MKKTNTRLHDFVRTTWVDTAARNRWQPRLEHLRQEVQRVESASVAAGFRPAALIQVEPQRLPEAMREFARQDLTFIPQTLQNTDPAGYAAAVREGFDMNRPWCYRGLVTRSDSPQEMPDSDAELGALLGYPPCCIGFFGETWVRDRHLDTTWPQAMRSGVEAEDRILNIREWDSGTNVVWRWLGLRMVPHLPCSFTCKASAESALSFKSLMDPEGRETMEEMLSWPLEWSVLHGIAEVKTPILRFVATSDFALDKHVVRLHSAAIPPEMPTGIEFPYLRRIGLALTESQAYRSAKQVLSGPPDSENVWLDNGFQSKEGLEKAHQPLIEAIKESGAARVLDLGCGNGRLLNAAGVEAPMGVDKNQAAIDRAGKWFPKGQYLCADIFDMDLDALRQFRADLVLFMPGRLLEGGSPALTSYLAEHGNVLLYSYGSETVQELLKAAPLCISQVHHNLSSHTCRAALRLI